MASRSTHREARCEPSRHPMQDCQRPRLERVRGASREGVVHPVGSVRLHAPWAPRARIACAGGNYAEHLAGAQAAISGRSVTAEEVHRESRAAGPWGFFKVPRPCGRAG